MTAIGRDDQAKALAPLLKPLGFRKLRATWHRETVDTIQVVNLQGSQWGPEFHLNVASYLRALGNESAPPAYRCHVQARILHPERKAEVLVHEIQDWFARFGSVDSLVEHFRNGTLPLATTGAARELLGTT